MELASNSLHLMQDVVLNPTWGSALALFVVSMLNEPVSLVPYSVVVSGQLFFLAEHFDTSFLISLLFFVAMPIALGATVGSLPLYTGAYFGGKPALERWGKYIKVPWEKVERMKTNFKGTWYDELIFLGLRAMPLLPSLPVSVLAGIIKMRFSTYLILTIAGFILRAAIMLGLIVLSVSGLSL